MVGGVLVLWHHYRHGLFQHRVGAVDESEGEIMLNGTAGHFRMEPQVGVVQMKPRPHAFYLPVQASFGYNG